MRGRTAALVLGIGSVLWADEGFCVRAVEALQAAWGYPGTPRRRGIPFEPLHASPLALDRYESGRPSAALFVRYPPRDAQCPPRGRAGTETLLPGPSPRLVSVFEAAATRMEGLAFVNPALEVEAGPSARPSGRRRSWRPRVN